MCMFYCPMNSEPGMIGETKLPYQDKEENKGTRRHALLFQNQEFRLSRFGQDKTKPIKGTLCDWFNDGSIIFIWYQGINCKACLSNANEKHYDQRSFPKKMSDS